MKHKTKENFTKQFEIWIKVFNSEAIISFVLDNMLRSQLEQNAPTFIQSQKWENIKNLISHEDEVNRNLGFSLLEGQTSTQVRLFFEKSSHDLIELIKIIKNIVEQLRMLKGVDKRLEEEQNKLVKALSEFELKISEAKTQEEKDKLSKEAEDFYEDARAREEERRGGMERLVNEDTSMIHLLIHKIEAFFEKYDVNLEESQVFTFPIS